MSSSAPKPSVARARLESLRRLTLRDRGLLMWLAEHHVLSASQIAQALFPSTRQANQRLKALYELGAVDRFGDTSTGSNQYLFALGPLGLTLHPTQWQDPVNPAGRTPRTSADRTARLAGSSRARHLLGVNGLFIDLFTHARTHPGTSLDRWWSEQRATAAWSLSGVRPDGHGIWRAGTTTVGFFLEHDNGTENLARVAAKFRAYSRLAEQGPRYPVLIRVPRAARETHLLRALGEAPDLPITVATSTHDRHPAEQSWTLPSDPGRRLYLHELPSDHGPDGPSNPHRYRAAARGF